MGVGCRAGMLTALRPVATEEHLEHGSPTNEP